MDHPPIPIRRLKDILSWFERGIISSREALGIFIEGADCQKIAEYVAVLPRALLEQMPQRLESEPSTDEEWESLYMPQLDGDDESMRRRKQDYRHQVEAFRLYFQKPPA